jgi:hypothetical protein
LSEDIVPSECPHSLNPVLTPKTQGKAATHPSVFPDLSLSAESLARGRGCKMSLSHGSCPQRVPHRGGTGACTIIKLMRAVADLFKAGFLEQFFEVGRVLCCALLSNQQHLWLLPTKCQ